MDRYVKLPCDLEESILSRVPPKSLVRLRAVCKQWKALFNDQTFIHNHSSRPRPQFIVLTSTMFYRVKIIDLDGVDPTVEVHMLPCTAIPLKNSLSTSITPCHDQFLFCSNPSSPENKIALWNPWLRKVKWIKYGESNKFVACGLGYDNSRPEKVYKMLGYFLCSPYNKIFAIFEYGFSPLKFINTSSHIREIAMQTHVPLNGDLYWVTCNGIAATGECFIWSFEFSKEIFRPFCIVPCEVMNPNRDTLVLAVYKEDRFSLLKQCYKTRKIEIWVTKKKIDKDEEVVWLNLMTFSTSNLPSLSNRGSRISYFIHDKTIVICCDQDLARMACVYIMRDGFRKKTYLGFRVSEGSCHCVYTPKLIYVPNKIRLSE